ncbi:hypothetical protein FB563_3037 [Streptomyces puniciscabiei]|uniref:Uncharacterized protein n=1 Tax=Streptomyces puniciscabiei TaxID=164348 RepID=A0A542UG29_9ACTN|nr:hypothetical protein FB563_3037 [Streptomyces puniciscabiei]
MVYRGEEPSRARANAVHFALGARTAWHSHGLGQTLVWTPPGEEHGHGAAPVRHFLPGLIGRVLTGRINPVRVFDLTLPLDRAAEGFTRPWTHVAPSRPRSGPDPRAGHGLSGYRCRLFGPAVTWAPRRPSPHSHRHRSRRPAGTPPLRP